MPSGCCGICSRIDADNVYGLLQTLLLAATDFVLDYCGLAFVWDTADLLLVGCCVVWYGLLWFAFGLLRFFPAGLLQILLPGCYRLSLSETTATVIWAAAVLWIFASGCYGVAA